MKQNQLSKVGRYSFIAEPFHCDFTHKLFIGHLGNNMLNAADYHSTERGYGMNYLNTMHKTWVLSRLAIEIEEMPKENEKFDITTWVDGVKRYFTSRNFAVLSQTDGKVMGYGRSIWAMIDTDTRQPTDIFSIRGGLINDYVDNETPCPIAAPTRVGISLEAKQERSVGMYYSDIDVNGHVNSVKYIEHALNLFDASWFKSHRIQRLEVAYVAESHFGDYLLFYREQCGDDEFAIRIDKKTEKEDTSIEVCRCKVKFVKV